MGISAILTLLFAAIFLCRAIRIALPKNLALWSVAGMLCCLFLAGVFASYEIFRLSTWDWNTGVLHACVYFGHCPVDAGWRRFVEALVILVPTVALTLALQSNRTRLADIGEKELQLRGRQ